MHKGLVFILDGLGDRPCPSLRHQTPLQAAATPTLDQLARRSQCGMMDALMPGIAVETHTGVGILFGLAPAAAAGLRRGPIEAAGIGLTTRHGDILLRANFASVEKTANGYRILDRRAGRIDAQAVDLCAALQEIEVGPGITASLHAATQHRAVLALRGDGLSAQISDTDPGGSGHMRILDSAPKPGPGALEAEQRAARAAAEALNRFTHRAFDILARHPVNATRAGRGLCAADGVIARSAGASQPLSNLLSRLNLDVAVVAAESTILGLAKLFGFTCCSSPTFTALPDTDLAGKLRLAMAAVDEHDLVFVHIKGTDTAAHDKNPALKAEFIARFDRELAAVDLGEIRVALCADHSTDSISGEHNGDSVPVLLRNLAGRRDAVQRYNETDCVAGALGRITAQGFLTTLLDSMGAFAGHHPAEFDCYRF